jgi:hypothetical protein
MRGEAFFAFAHMLSRTCTRSALHALGFTHGVLRKLTSARQ